MGSLQVLKSSLSSPSLGFQSRKSSCSVSDITSSSSSSSSEKKKKRICKLRSSSSSRRKLSFFRVCCRVRDDENETNGGGGGEEPPESLFMKELKRRGMNPTSLLEDNNKSSFGQDEEVNLKEGGRGFTKRKAVSTDFEIGEGLANQRERSMALNSEGLEGLIPRAKLLLTLGGTFFLGFWPLILVNVVIFIALYLYFGATFIHDGTDPAMSPPPYIDPYILLEEERLQKLSQAAPQVK